MEKHADYIYYSFVHLKIYFSMWFDQAARSLKENTSTNWTDWKADSMHLGGEQKTKLNYSTYQTKFNAKMTKMKWNYTANMIMSVYQG